MKTLTTAMCAALALALATPVAGLAAELPASWDGLIRVKSKRLQNVYLLPGADFSGYSQVLLDPSEVAFRKDWLRDYNMSSVGLDDRLSAADARKMIVKAQTGFDQIFAKACTSAGLQVATQPGPGVLRVRTAVVNVFVDAPDTNSIGMERSYSPEAGGATLVLEVRDSQTNALLGRAVDGRIAGDTGPYVRNSVTNRQDFGVLFRHWAKSSIEGLEALKTAPAPASPIKASN